jgi:hypothetical protein
MLDTTVLLAVTARTQCDKVAFYIVAEFAPLHQVMYV